MISSWLVVLNGLGATMRVAIRFLSERAQRRLDLCGTAQTRGVTVIPSELETAARPRLGTDIVLVQDSHLKGTAPCPLLANSGHHMTSR